MTDPIGLQDRLIRHRAWVVMGVLVLALVAVGVTGLGAKKKVGGVTSADRPRVVFGSAVTQAPPSSVLVLTNGWVATVGAISVAVYAGSQAAHHRNGLLVIALKTGSERRQRSVVVRGAGAITLLRPPTVDSEQAAEQATLHFVTANGDSGSLNLSNDRVSLTN